MDKCMLSFCLAAAFAAGCGDSDDKAAAQVSLKNDFNNPAMSYQPPWTICASWYLGVEFGRLGAGESSAAKTVKPGLDYALMVAAWQDPRCAAENCLPIASKNEEEVVDGQTREIAINMPNHQGPCPPTGTQPIPAAQYERIRTLWPSYGFLPYADRAQNPQCLQ